MRPTRAARAVLPRRTDSKADLTTDSRAAGGAAGPRRHGHRRGVSRGDAMRCDEVRCAVAARGAPRRRRMRGGAHVRIGAPRPRDAGGHVLRAGAAAARRLPRAAPTRTCARR
ncbi:hypothetical protein AQ751_30415 [Burkholderia pseudomallei]|nr:hypothetical protein AQ751_30415 [Burkholderia pseudomallei]